MKETTPTEPTWIVGPPMGIDNQRTIFQRLNAVQKAVSFVKKQKPTGLQYPIVSHDAVIAKCRPALVEHGVLYLIRNLAVTQNGNRTEVFFDVRFQNVDNPDDWVDVPTVGYGIDAQDKGPGKALTYGVKTALIKTLGLEAGEGEDPDFDQDTNHHPDEKSPDEKTFVERTRDRIKATTTSAALRPVDNDVRLALETGNITDDVARELRGLIRTKVENFNKNASRVTSPPPHP